MQFGRSLQFQSYESPPLPPSSPTQPPSHLPNLPGRGEEVAGRARHPLLEVRHHSPSLRVSLSLHISLSLRIAGLSVSLSLSMFLFQALYKDLTLSFSSYLCSFPTLCLFLSISNSVSPLLCTSIQKSLSPSLCFILYLIHFSVLLFASLGPVYTPCLFLTF